MADSATIAAPLSAASRTDPGRVRANNEDLPVLDADRGVFGVIDGVGGQAAGELAAAIARDVILQRLARPLGTPAERVREAIAIANNEIFRRASTAPDLTGMTCVVTLAVVADGRLTIGHVGDSRLYKIRPAGLRKLTHDHSPVGEREDAHEIDELEAMRHPRRHEVFRDVGSALRDKDEDDYVEVIEDVLDDDAALLVCSDGLTDMIPVATIERLVREHAGDPDAVAVALVAAANEAGGRDNVTVVYAEAPGFSSALRRADGHRAGLAARARQRLRSLVASRTLWFAAGLAAGMLGALLLIWRDWVASPVGPRTFVAAPAGSPSFGTLAAAVGSARAGDLISLEPGTYPEQLILPDGVSLKARVAGASVFVRPAGAPDGWVAITAAGDGGGTIAGVRIASTPEAAIDVGVRLSGHGRLLELIQIDGPVRTGIDLAADGSMAVQGSHFSLAGPAIAVAAGSQLEVAGSIFVAGTAHRPSATAGPDDGTYPQAITVGDGARVMLRHNVFSGFGPDPFAGLPAADREQMRAGNVVVTAGPSAVR